MYVYEEYRSVILFSYEALSGFGTRVEKCSLLSFLKEFV